MSISKKESITEDENIILGIIYGLEQRKKDPETGEIIINEQLKIKPDKEGIIKLGSFRFKDKTDKWPLLLEGLTQKQYLILTDKCYSLSDNGRILGKKIQTKWVCEMYDDLLLRCIKSEAYGQFCDRVFGKNLCQYNAMDMKQLDKMLECLNLNDAKLVLDLGCGIGKVTEYISNKTGAKIIGVDFSTKAIEWAQNNIQTKNKKLSFQVGNINELTFEPKTFDAIISIDTLYTVDDIDKVIRKLKEILKSKGQLGIFFGQYREPSESEEILRPENTKIGKSLHSNGLSFQSFDFTKNAKQIWIREVAVVEELKEEFEKEDNLILYNDRKEDSGKVLNWIENNQQKRYLYHAKK